MSSSEVATDWVRRLEAGDRAGAQKLWEGYYRRLVGLSRKKLRDTPRREVNEEDIALSAFDSFCRGVEQGRFPCLENRNDLWHLLMVITLRKVADQIKSRRAQRRGGGKVRGESAFVTDDSDEGRGIEQAVGQEPSPAFAVAMAEQCEVLLRALPKDDLRSIALLKMEGYTNPQIAERLTCSLATVERKLALIRATWKQYQSAESSRKVTR
jgi:DNA-directed RNA polymerase specialized sigma24 family protein